MTVMTEILTEGPDAEKIADGAGHYDETATDGTCTSSYHEAAAAGTCTFTKLGSSLTVFDFTTLGSSLALRAFTRVGSGLSVPVAFFQRLFFSQNLEVHVLRVYTSNSDFNSQGSCSRWHLFKDSGRV